jgi:N-acyl-D-amino-acid deacylase
VEAFVDLSLESNGRVLLNYPFLNQRLDAVEEMLADPNVVMGLADAGAHVGQIMDASQPTYVLATWGRDRREFGMEECVRRLTSDTAGLFGLADRGVLRPGAFADVNVIDLDSLALTLPEYVHDFPGGAGRYVQGHPTRTVAPSQGEFWRADCPSTEPPDRQRDEGRAHRERRVLLLAPL